MLFDLIKGMTFDIYTAILKVQRKQIYEDSTNDY